MPLTSSFSFQHREKTEMKQSISYNFQELPHATKWAIAPAKLLCKKVCQVNSQPSHDKEKLFFPSQSQKQAISGSSKWKTNAPATAPNTNAYQQKISAILQPNHRFGFFIWIMCSGVQQGQLWHSVWVIWQFFPLFLYIFAVSFPTKMAY